MRYYVREYALCGHCDLMSAAEMEGMSRWARTRVTWWGEGWADPGRNRQGHKPRQPGLAPFGC